MTDDGLAAFYRRYNACCNEHRFEDLAGFVARDVVINGTGTWTGRVRRGAARRRPRVPDYHRKLRHLVVDSPRAGRRGGRHRGRAAPEAD